MKNIIILLLFLSFAAHAQQGPGNRVKALRTAYLTERLELSVAEAEKFWPVYNQYERQMSDLRRDVRRNNQDLADDAQQALNLSAQEAQEKLGKIWSQETRLMALRKEKYNALAEIIGYQKVLALYLAEKEFSKKMLHELRRRGQQGKPPNR